MIRQIALFLRWRSQLKQEQQALRLFKKWSVLFEQNRTSNPIENKLALVRLDDIGDYLLWRNCLAVYKNSARFIDYKVTLIGNIVWRPVFEAYDSATVDETIWIDKHLYLSDSLYREKFLKEIRNKNFGTVICPSRTRPLLLDDLIALATGASVRIGVHNSRAISKANKISDAVYNQFFPEKNVEHEFIFNRKFTTFASGMNVNLDGPILPALNSNYFPKQVICFIGASAKSKTWPIDYWIELVKLLQQKGYEPLLSGGKNEKEIAEKITASTQCKSIVGQTNLVGTLEAISGAAAVITGDTMAAHSAVSFNKPTVILANGVNANRFVAYKEAGFKNVKTVYTQEYLNSKKNKAYKAVSKDMESIKPEQVFSTVQQLLNSI
ncbi:MAG: glycosyltransferase family 9 protein [Chitinophagaceae bacterium]|jgi:ADP-heptose:LPS heptosyltransferase